MLKNKSILLPREVTDGYRVCVMNSIHDDYDFDFWFKTLAPSRQLIEAYVINKTMSWPEFKKLYLEEQKNNYPTLLVLKKLIEVADANGVDVTLLCGEETPEHCHRAVIMELLDNMVVEL